MFLSGNICKIAFDVKSKNKIVRLFAFALGWMWLATSASAASFDCSKATIREEYLICSNFTLSELDSMMAMEYNKVLRQKGGIKQDQKAWLKGREHCGDLNCLVDYYQDRIQTLRGIGVLQSTLTASDSTIPWDYIPPDGTGLLGAVTKGGQLIGFDIGFLENRDRVAIQLVGAHDLVIFENRGALIAYEEQRGWTSSMRQNIGALFGFAGKSYKLSRDPEHKGYLSTIYHLSKAGETVVDFNISYIQGRNKYQRKEVSIASGAALFYPLNDGTYMLVLPWDRHGRQGCAIRITESFRSMSHLLSKKIFFIESDDLNRIIGDSGDDQDDDMNDEQADRNLRFFQHLSS